MYLVSGFLFMFFGVVVLQLMVGFNGFFSFGWFVVVLMMVYQGFYQGQFVVYGMSFVMIYQ